MGARWRSSSATGRCHESAFRALACRASVPDGSYRHLCGTDIESLRTYAAAIGLHRAWEQVSNSGAVHYDVTGRGLVLLDSDIGSGIVRELERAAFVKAIAEAAVAGDCGAPKGRRESDPFSAGLKGAEASRAAVGGGLREIEGRQDGKTRVRGSPLPKVQRQDGALPYREDGDLPALRAGSTGGTAVGGARAEAGKVKATSDRFAEG